MVALDSAVILNPAVWEASGHVAGFSDPLIDCRTCKLRFRADRLEDAQLRPAAEQATRRVLANATSPRPRQFNLMFETQVGAMEDASARARTCGPRPRRASSSTSRTSRSSPAASRRSGSRRRASPSATRSRPATSSSASASSSRWRWSTSSRPTRRSAGTSTGSINGSQWYLDLGLRRSQLRVREHSAEERSHYSSGTSDIEYLYPIGWQELEGVANRGDFDLTQHTQHSGTKLEWVGQDGERYTPLRDRARGVDRAHLRGHARGRLRRRSRRGSRPHRPAPAPGGRAGQGGDPAADPEERRDGGTVARTARGAAPPLARRVRRRRTDRSPLPAAGRDRDAVGFHDRRPDARGRNGDRARARLARAGAAAALRRRAWLEAALERPWESPKQ